jgi:hypothetical protein
MEKLFPQALAPDFEEDSAKEFYFCASDSIEILSEKIDPTSRYYALFVAMDARNVDADEIAGAATKLLSRGLVSFCAWGPDCERVHDLFDQSAFETNEKLTGNDVVLTYWHSKESLLEALWFFVHAAHATESFTGQCSNWIIATIGNPEWERKIRANIKEVVFEPSNNEDELSS